MTARAIAAAAIECFVACRVEGQGFMEAVDAAERYADELAEVADYRADDGGEREGLCPF